MKQQHDHDEVENAAAAYFVQRAIPPLQATLRMYRNAFYHLAERWRDDDVASLQHQVEEIVPEALLFDVWRRLLHARNASENHVESTQAFLQEVLGALSRILEKNAKEGDLALMSEVGEPARDVAGRYMELLEKSA